jgi:hypothetical protein
MSPKGAPHALQDLIKFSLDFYCSKRKKFIAVQSVAKPLHPKKNHFFSSPPCKTLYVHTDLSMKEGSLIVLFCAYEIHRTGMLQIAFLLSLESSRRGGVHGLGSMRFGLAVQKFLNIE